MSIPKADAWIQELKAQSGSAAIGMIRAGQGVVSEWADEGSIALGDGIVRVLVAGDTRGIVFAVLQRRASFVRRQLLSEPALR